MLYEVITEIMIFTLSAVEWKGLFRQPFMVLTPILSSIPNGDIQGVSGKFITTFIIFILLKVC